MANGHGGRRRGAGAKAGTGGVAVRALRTEARAMLATIVGTAADPLRTVIDFCNDAAKPDAFRLEAASICLRYLHPTLSAAAVQHSTARPDADAVVHRLSERLAGMAPATSIEVEAETPSAQVGAKTPVIIGQT